jgi:hypothetical protein
VFWWKDVLVAYILPGWEQDSSLGSPKFGFKNSYEISKTFRRRRTCQKM